MSPCPCLCFFCPEGMEGKEGKGVGYGEKRKDWCYIISGLELSK